MGLGQELIFNGLYSFAIIEVIERLLFAGEDERQSEWCVQTGELDNGCRRNVAHLNSTVRLLHLLEAVISHMLTIASWAWR